MHIVMLTYDIIEVMTCSGGTLYKGYGIELWIGYGLILMVDVMFIGWLVCEIELGKVRKQCAFTTRHSKPPLSPSP